MDTSTSSLPEEWGQVLNAFLKTTYGNIFVSKQQYYNDNKQHQSILNELIKNFLIIESDEPEERKELRLHAMGFHALSLYPGQFSGCTNSLGLNLEFLFKCLQKHYHSKPGQPFYLCQNRKENEIPLAWKYLALFLSDVCLAERSDSVDGEEAYINPRELVIHVDRLHAYLSVFFEGWVSLHRPRRIERVRRYSNSVKCYVNPGNKNFQDD